MPRRLLTLDDLDRDDVTRILERASSFAKGGKRKLPGPRFSTTLAFFTSSLRSRLGFAEATIRLGGACISIDSFRGGGGLSAEESLADTLRIAAGTSDLVVSRTPTIVPPLELPAPWINAGDNGGEHPTQALIDLFAMERLAGPIGTLSVAIVGDLGARCARSLLRLLARYRPARVGLIAPISRMPDADTLSRLGPFDTFAKLDDGALQDVDVVYFAGLAPIAGGDRLDADARADFNLSVERLRSLKSDAIILSPLPLIDEVTLEARCDPRFRAFQQSDDGVAVRMATIEWALGRDMS